MLFLSPSSAQQTISVIGDAWTLRILRTAFRGGRRYGDFINLLGISRGVLSDRLEKLVANGLLVRQAEEGSHPEYWLSPRGLDLWSLFLSMWLWETKWGTGQADKVPVNDRPRQTIVHTVCGHEMRPELHCEHCHAAVRAFDTAAEAGPGYLDVVPHVPSMFRRVQAAGGAEDVQTLMRVIGDRWNCALLAAAFKGVQLFSQFEKDLGIAPNQLSDRLAELQQLGILRGHAYAGERQMYKLTRAGLAMFPVILEMMRWGDQWLWPKGAPIVVRHKPCGNLLGAKWFCSHCQQALARTEVRLF